MARQSTIGNGPLDALVPDQATATATKTRLSGKRRVGVFLLVLLTAFVFAGPVAGMAQARPGGPLAGKPNFFSSYYAGARALDLKQYARAALALRRAITLNPRFAEAYCELGIAELELHRPQRAIAILKQALALRPALASRYMAHFSLGEAFRKLNKPPQAEGAYRDALRIHANFALAHKRLAQIYLSNRQRARAIAAFLRYLRYAPFAGDSSSVARKVRHLQRQARRQPSP